LTALNCCSTRSPPVPISGFVPSCASKYWHCCVRLATEADGEQRPSARKTKC
jgi:hypothetical protein